MQKHSGIQTVREFKHKKQNMLKDQFKERTEQEKKLIYKFELEAQKLEKEEEELIKELQAT